MEMHIILPIMQLLVRRFCIAESSFPQYFAWGVA